MATNSVSWIGVDIQRMLNNLQNMAKNEVLVGIPESSSSRNNGAINNASLGYIHENGSPAKNIPARPWLIPGILDNEQNITQYLGRALNSALDGNDQEANKNLQYAGIEATNSVKTKINSNIQPSLSLRTLIARRKRGITRTNTLVDTAEFRNSVNWVLVKK